MKETEIWRILELAYEDIEPLLPRDVFFGEDLRLLGEGGLFDSIAIVALCSAIEDKVAEKTGREIRIISDHAFSRQKSPFKDMRSLVAYIQELLADSPSTIAS